MTTPTEHAILTRLRAKVGQLTPAMLRALLKAYAILEAAMGEHDVARLIATGGADAVLREVLTDPVLTRAFQAVQLELTAEVADGVRYYAATQLPHAGKVDGTLAVHFNVLDPNVITAIRTLDTAVIQGLKDEVRETTRAFVEQGLRRGVNPRSIARNLRGVIGLGPSQMQQVENFRAALEGRDGRSVKDYTARDKRFDRTITRMAKEGKSLSPAQVDKMVEVYRQRRVAINAEANARTATLNALKAGQRLSWEQAAEQGIVDRARMRKTWVGVLDARERDAHVAMEGQTVPFDALFTNGEMIPGDSTYNCRCIARYFQASSS
jgi:hypothetical protein